jgi:putative transposase
MIVIHDDFSGLMPITASLFPNSDVQLCVVHMQRNAKTHLSKSDAVEFQQRWRAIKTCWDLELGEDRRNFRAGYGRLLLCRDRFLK